MNRPLSIGKIVPIERTFGVGLEMTRDMDLAGQWQQDSD